MMTRLLQLLLAATLIATAGAAFADAPAPASSEAPPAAVVYCYDTARDLVARVLLGDCHGKIVTPAEADAINAKHDDRLRQSLSRSDYNTRGGLHLAGIGTGFYTDDEGRLLTNYHVVDDCSALTVRINSDETLQARPLAVDSIVDLALLQVDTQSSTTAEFPPEGTLFTDTFVAVVGFPNQGLPPLEPFLTPGVLLQQTANVGGREHMVIRADLRHGDSGGPIFDREGRVIGIINAKLDTARYFNATGMTVTDIGLGIPRHTVVEFLQRNNATHEESTGAGILDERQILKRASGFVVRVECWRGPSAPAAAQSTGTAAPSPASP